MKILKEKQAGAEYEAAGTSYLNKEFSEYDNIEFEQAGENNSLVSDILVKKDDEDKFYIECKDTTSGAQAGEFGVKLDDGILSLISKTHDIDTALGIIDAVNNSINVDKITTGTIKLINIPGVKELAEQRIFDIYKYDKNTEYIMAPGNIKFNIASIDDWNKLLKLKEVNLRWKANNSSNISNVAQKEVIPYIEEVFGAKNIKLIKSGSGSKIIFDSDEDINNYYSFETNSGRKFLVTLVSDDRDGAYTGTTQKYQLRTPGGRGIIIFTLGMNNPSVNEIDELKADLGVKEDLNMMERKNLSEELVLNDVIKLDAGEEEVSTQPDKETEKEINKEFAEKVKDVEEINDAEAPKLSIKVKGLTEKLILEEPSDMLNEDVNPYSYDAYSDAVSDLASIVKRLLERTNGIPHEDAIQLCYDAFEEAINDNLEENLEEEVLDEKIPSDLMKAYKKARYSGLPNTDLQNADYKEVTPEEALKLYKQDPQSIRLLIGGNLVDFRENGWASLDHRVQWLPRDKQYVSSKGKVTVDTAKIPTKYLLKIADKIYATNENTPEGKKDAELYSQRSQNPESRHPAADVSPSNVLSSRDNVDSYYSDRRRGSFGYYDTPAYLNRQIKDKEEELAKWQNMLETESWPRYYSKEEVEDRIKDIKNTIISTQGKLKDNQARIRYTSSEVKLQEPFKKYLHIKDNLGSMEREVNRAKDKLDTAIKYGAPASRDNRERLEDLKNRLDDTLKRIALVELELEETDEEDAAEVARAEEKYNQTLNQYNSAKSELDQLLRKNK